MRRPGSCRALALCGAETLLQTVTKLQTNVRTAPTATLTLCKQFSQIPLSYDASHTHTSKALLGGETSVPLFGPAISRNSFRMAIRSQRRMRGQRESDGARAASVVLLRMRMHRASHSHTDAHATVRRRGRAAAGGAAHCRPRAMGGTRAMYEHKRMAEAVWGAKRTVSPFWPVLLMVAKSFKLITPQW
jgi:hypothetical protein